MLKSSNITISNTSKGPVGLTKTWKPIKSSTRFYTGQLLVASQINEAIYTLLEEKLIKYDVEMSKICWEIGDEVVCFAVTPNEQYCLLSTRKNALQYYHINDDENNENLICLRTMKGHQMPVTCMSFDHSGVLCATGSADKTIRVWDVTKGYCTHSFRDHQGVISTLRFCFHPSSLSSSSLTTPVASSSALIDFQDEENKNMILCSTSEDSTTHIYDLEQSSCIGMLKEHMSTPTCLAFDEQRRLMVTCGRDKVLNFSELTSYSHVKTVAIMDELESVIVLDSAHSKLVLGSAYKQGNTVLITAGQKGILRGYMFQLKDYDKSNFVFESIFAISLHKTQHQQEEDVPTAAHSNDMMGVQRLDYIPHKNIVLAATADHVIYLFDIVQKGLRLRKQVVGNHDDILDILVLPIPLLATPTAPITTPIIAPISTTTTPSMRMAVITNSMQVRLLDDSFASTPLDGHTDIVLAVDASPDGRWLVTSAKDYTCRLWDIEAARCVAVLEGHADAVGSVGISQRLASYASKTVFAVSGGADKILKRWAISPLLNNILQLNKQSTKQQQQQRTTASHSVRAHDKDINCVVVAPNDGIVASASQDRTIRLWSGGDLTALSVLKGHKRGVWKVAFSPVDRCLASCSSDRTVKLWSMADYSCLHTFEGHTASVLAVRFVNKGQQLLSSASDGLIRLWTIRSGECDNTFDEHENRVWALSVVAGDEYFVSGGSDAKIILWEDCTASEEQARLQALEQTLLVEQQLNNDIKNKKYDKALFAALELNHSNKVLGIIMSILEMEGPQEDATTDNETASAAAGVVASMTTRRIQSLQPYLTQLSTEQLDKLLVFLKDWNTNSKYSFPSQAILSCLMTIKDTEALMASKVLSENLEGLIAYSERHFQRIDRLFQSAYVLEYMSSQMSLLPVDNNESKTENSSKRRRKMVGDYTITDDSAGDEDDDVNVASLIFHPTTTASREQGSTTINKTATRTVATKSAVKRKKLRAA